MYDIIRKAMETSTLLDVYYKNAKGERSHKNIEPYSFRQGDLMGFDVDEGHIKRFKMENFLQAFNTENKFSPRWTIEL